MLPAHSAVHAGIHPQIPIHAVPATVIKPRSRDSLVHHRDSELPDQRNISSVHVHGKRRNLLL